MELPIRIIHMIENAPTLSQKIVLILGLVLIFTMFNFVITFPVIFNFFIIPHIQKKVGKKLEYTSPVYDLYPFGKFFGRYAEIAGSLLWRYLGLKLKNDPYANKLNPRMALAKVNYDVRTASRFTIIMSFLAILNPLLFVICGGIIWYLK